MFKKVLSVLKAVAALFVVATTMAVACPQPAPPEPEREVQVTKSAERKSFESMTDEGLYLQGKPTIVYDVDSFQKAINKKRKFCRIQSDDQLCYVNVEYKGTVPSKLDDEATCYVQYSMEENQATTLIVKYVVIKKSDEKLWLWNEFQKVGLLVPII